MESTRNFDMTFTIDDMLLFIKRRKYVLLTMILVCIAIAFLITSQTTKVYQSVTDILVDIQPNEVVDIKSVTPQTSGDLNALRSQAELMASRVMLEKVVTRLDLISDPEFNHYLREPSVMRSIKDWFKGIVNDLRGIVDDQSASGLTDDKILAVSVSSLRDKIEVSLLPGSYIMQVTATAYDPQKAALLANTLAETYIAYLQESKLRTAKDANSWIEERLNILRAEVQESERELEEFKSRQNLLSTSGEDLTEQQVLSLNFNIVTLEGELAEKTARLATAKNALSTGMLDAESLGDVLSSPVIRSLRGQQAQIASQRAELSSRYAPSHPSMIEVNNQASDVAQKIREEVRRIVTSLSNEVKVTQQKLASLKSSLSGLKNELSDNSEFAPKLKQLESAALTNQRIFEVFLERFQETNLQDGLIQAQASIISPAIARLKAISPNAPLNMVLGAFVGGVLGLLIAGLIEFFSRGVTAPDTLDKTLNVKYLVHIPRDKKVTNFNRFLKVLQKKSSELYRPFREARFTLDQWANHDHNILSIVSSVPDEGKTSIAFGLAMMGQSRGKRTLLIDCDYRKRQLSRRLQHSKEDGLFNLLAREGLDNTTLITEVNKLITSVADKDTATHGSAVDFLPAGQDIEDHIWDIMQGQEMATLFSYLRTKYDLIIVDTAPLLAVKETAYIVKHTDAVLLVARWRQTPLRAMQHAVAILREHHMVILGGILSMTIPKKLAMYDRESREYFAEKYKYY